MDTVRLDELFETRNGQGLTLVSLDTCDSAKGVNFVSRKGTNNGVAGRVVPPKGVRLGLAGEITVSLAGSVLSAFVQNDDFLLPPNTLILTPKNRDMSLEEKLYYCKAINFNAERYSYGRQADRTIRQLQLPATPPDWVHDYSVDTILGEFDKAMVERESDAGAVDQKIDTSDWAEFRIGDLFEIKRGNVKGIKSLTLGDVPVVSARETDNGVAQRADVVPQFDAGTVSVSVNGAVGFAAVQQEAWSGTGDVMALLLKDEAADPSTLAKLAVCTLIRAEGQRFGYARKLNQERLENMAVRLPALLDENHEAVVDWDRLDGKMQELAFSQYVLTGEL